ncbi:MAG TPA: hypothetical protein VFO65_13750, partial [Acidimicrobiales bacterium]|nr:hypothetical protein [Acidimicrobiales bacterium]
MGRKDRDSRREEIEREAAEELRRIAAQSAPPGQPYRPPAEWGAPSRGGGYTPPSPPPRNEPPPPRTGGYQPPGRTSSYQPPPRDDPPPPRTGGYQAPGRTSTYQGPGSFQAPGPGQPLVSDGPDYDDRMSPDEEEEALIEMALTDWAAQRGGRVSPEDLAVPRIDPGQAEALRDRMLHQELERQRRLKERSRLRQAQPQARGPQPSTRSSGPPPKQPPPSQARSSRPRPVEDRLSPHLQEMLERDPRRAARDQAAGQSRAEPDRPSRQMTAPFSGGPGFVAVPQTPRAPGGGYTPPPPPWAQGPEPAPEPAPA